MIPALTASEHEVATMARIDVTQYDSSEEKLRKPFGKNGHANEQKERDYLCYRNFFPGLFSHFNKGLWL